MQKFEYVDLNRFLVSLGLALMFGAAAVFWLFLREPFDLAYTTEQIKALTPAAQSAIQKRQDLVGIALNVLPVVCAVGAVLGGMFLIAGVWRWIPIQATYEKTQKLQLRKLEIETQPMSEQQIAEKARAEVIEDRQMAISDKGDTEAIAALDEAVSDYLETESSLLDVLSTRLPPDFKLLPHRRFGPHSFDALIKSPQPSGPEYLVEIKKLRADSNPKILIDAIKSVSHATGWENIGAEQPVNRIPLVIAVVPKFHGRMLERVTTYINDTNNNPTPFGQSLIRLVAPSRLRSLSAAEVQAFLDPSQRLYVLADEDGADSEDT